MAGYGEDDLISFVSDGPSIAATPVATSMPASTTREGKPAPAPPGDIFANLTSMARARAWKPTHTAPPPKPGLNGSNARVDLNHQTPGHTPAYQSVESYLNEDTFDPRAPAQPAQASRGMIGPSPGNTDGSLATGSTTLVEPEYDEESMRRLEELMAEMNALGIEDSHETEPDETQPPAQCLIEVNEPQPTLQVFNLPPSLPIYRASPPIQENEPVVRLTQAVYRSIMAQISVLQQDKTEALKKLGAIQRELSERREDERDASSTVGKLHYQLEANRDYKAAMGRDIRQKDIELYKKEMEIDSLKSKVVEMEMLQKQVERLNAELDYLRTSKKAEETAHTRAMAQITAIKNREIADLKAAAARSHTVVSDHATRAQNLVDTQTQRERKIKQLQEKLLEEQGISNKLRDEIDSLRKSLPSRQHLEAVQDQLRSKTSEFDRQKNELKHLTRRYEINQDALVKVQDEKKSLRGAAHLIVPAVNTRLPKLVFPCMECFLKNIDCDASSRCHNCTQGDEKCARWRCAMRHVTGSCTQAPCRFVHDGNGWLMLNGPRPQW